MKRDFNIYRLVKALLPMLSAIAALTPAAYGQTTASLRFIPEELDYGIIKESDGEVKRNIRAVNASQDTTFIISARTSCGCTGVAYSSDPIAPGDTTTVSVTYDATNRPGKFLKTVRLFTGKDRTPNSFKIKGTVVPSEKHLDRTYPEKSGVLRLSTLIVSAGELRPNGVHHYAVGIYNDSDKPLKLKGTSDSDAMSVTIEPETVDPRSITSVILKVNAADIRKEAFDLHAYILNEATGEKLATIAIGGDIRRSDTQN